MVDTYDPAVLHTDTSPDAILGAMRAFYERRQPGDRYSLNLLFHGLPGTGKTEFVRYLAETLDRELIQRRASDLLSMWVGGTEQAIAQAFRQVEAAEGILLLDEADSLFLNRTQVQHSRERSRTNELLTQMKPTPVSSSVARPSSGRSTRPPFAASPSRLASSRSPRKGASFCSSATSRG